MREGAEEARREQVKKELKAKRRAPNAPKPAQARARGWRRAGGCAKGDGSSSGLQRQEKFFAWRAQDTQRKSKLML